jgi:hypothetical protein
MVKWIIDITADRDLRDLLLLFAAIVLLTVLVTLL